MCLLYISAALTWLLCSITTTGIAQSVQQLATRYTVRGSPHGEGEIFRTRPDRTLYNGHRFTYPGVALANHPGLASVSIVGDVLLYSLCVCLACNGAVFTFIPHPKCCIFVVTMKYLQNFEMSCWRRTEKINWTDSVRNEEVQRRGKRKGTSRIQQTEES